MARYVIFRQKKLQRVAPALSPSPLLRTKFWQRGSAGFVQPPPPPSGSPFNRLLTVGSSHHLWLSFTPLDPVGKKIRQIRGISSVAIKKSRAISILAVVKVVLLRG